MRAVSFCFLVWCCVGCIESEAPTESANAAPDDESPAFATAHLRPVVGETATGLVTFVRADNALRVEVNVSGVVTPGKHGLHIHEGGACRFADGAAGRHFNPTDQRHGAPNARVAHFGDLGNIDIATNGLGNLVLYLHDASYDQEVVGGWRTLIGRTVVLHAEQDDLHTQPHGGSGPPIACGRIVGPDPEKS